MMISRPSHLYYANPNIKKDGFYTEKVGLTYPTKFNISQRPILLAQDYS